MKTITTLSLMLCALTSNATIIEDDADRLVFDLEWVQPQFGSLQLEPGYPGLFGSGGSHVFVLSGMTSNPYFFFVEIHRVIDQIQQPSLVLGVLFRRFDWDAPPTPTPDPIFGTSTAPQFGHQIPADHIFAVPGNDHAARIVVGTVVPDTGSTLLLLSLALGVMGWRRKA